jgi:VanZ family protein
MNRRNRAALRAIAPLALMAVIFYLSAQPATGEHPWWEMIVRKLGHITGYALLTALWAWALQGVVRRSVVIAVCISFAYACTDEFHQTFVRDRTGTPLDIGVDAVGMGIAVLLLRARRRSPAGGGKVDARGRAAGSSPARSP